MNSARRSPWLATGLLLLGTLTLGPGPSSAPDQPAVQPSPIPPLQVRGNRVTTPAGTEVPLKGVSLIDPLFLATVNEKELHRQVEIIAEDWGATVLRVPIFPELWQRSPRYLARYVDPLVEEAREEKIYVILGWHAQHNPLSLEQYSPEWAFQPPWNGRPVNSSVEMAEAALRRIADRYADQPHVLYSIYSEPARITWADWQPVAERLVTAVQETDPGAVTIVPGVDWGYDLRGAIDRPVDRPNIIYETHPYPHSGTDWMGVTDTLRQQAPVLIGEFGFLKKHVPDTVNVEAYGRELIREAERQDLAGWIAWVWDHQWEPELLESYAGPEPTRFGEFVRRQLTETSTPHLSQRSN